MGDITLPYEKRRNYPGEISLWCAMAGFIALSVYLQSGDIYKGSLFGHELAGTISGICLLLYLLTFLAGLCCWLTAVVSVIFFSKKRYKFTGCFGGLLIPFITLAILMPTLGRLKDSGYYVYHEISDPAAVQYLQENLKDAKEINRNFLQITYWNETSESKNTIKIKYNLKSGVVNDNLPKSFSVVIDRKTRKTEILPDESIQQEPK